MKRHLVLRRWGWAAGLCLLLAGILTVSLGWATASSSPPPPPTMQYGVYLPLVLRAELSGGVALGPAPQDQDTAPPLPEPVATP